MTTGSHSEPCINWPCAKGAGHAGPCGTSRDDLTSKERVEPLVTALIAERERLTADRDKATAIIRQLLDVLRRSDLDYIDQSDGAALPTDDEWTDALEAADQYLGSEAP